MPLAGVLVVDVTTTLLGPYCTLILAQLGADVVKIEAPEGDPLRGIDAASDNGMSSMFVTLNRGKRSVVLDLKDEDGRAALLQLAAGADVFIHNTKPDTAVRLGIDYATIAAANERIVHCAAIGFGSDGPYAKKPAYDDIIQAASGVASLQGYVTGTPEYVRSAIGDKTSALFAVQAILAALLHRYRTGEGQAVEVPMFEALVSFVLVEQLGGMVFEPPRGPMRYPRTVSRYRRPFQTADGFLAVMPYTDRQWLKLFDVLGAAELAVDERFSTIGGRTANIDELYQLVEASFVARSADTWVEMLDERGVPCMRINSLEDLFADPHLHAVGMFEVAPDAAGDLVRSVRSPLAFSKSTPNQLRDAPRLGQHTDEILRTLAHGGNAAENWSEQQG